MWHALTSHSHPDNDTGRQWSPNCSVVSGNKPSVASNLQLYLMHFHRLYWLIGWSHSTHHHANLVSYIKPGLP
jgi:hypothetical protein